MEVSSADMKVLKLYLSSLFARRQKFLWINSNDPLTWFFSTMGSAMPFGNKRPNSPQPVAPLHMYTPTIDDYVHQVSFKNDRVVSIMTSIFPFIERGMTCITVPEFSAVLNKKLLDLVIYEGESKALIEKSPKGKEPFLETVAVKVGTHMYGSLVSHFNTFERNVLKCEDVCTIPFDLTSLVRAKVSHIEIDFKKLPKINTDYLLKIPVFEGLSIICASEYVKKAKVEGTVHVCLAVKRKTAIVVLVYEDENVLVESVCPVSMWFPNIA